MKGQLSLFLNPIMSLTTEQQELCLRDFEQVEYRLRNTDHHFHRDMLIASTQMLILNSSISTPIYMARTISLYKMLPS